MGGLFGGLGSGLCVWLDVVGGVSELGCGVGGATYLGPSMMVTARFFDS